MAEQALKTVDPLPLTKPESGSIMEDVIIKGDLAKLSPEARARYYMETCRSLAINPLVKPFEYISLNGKLTLYATRTATDQLRATRGVSIKIVERRTENDLYVVVAQAQIGSRLDESTGAVSIAGLKGEALANAYMKCETKSKRRVTLSICGLGWMDELETATVPGARIVPVDTQTGEIMDPERTVDPETGEVFTQQSANLQTPKQRAEDHRITQNNRFHGIAGGVGLTDDATRLYAHVVMKCDSRADLSGQQLSDLADLTVDNLARLADGSVNPFVELANQIAAAGSETTLTAIATRMVNEGVLEPWLVGMGKARRAELAD